MWITYVNRKGHIYYLCEGVTKTGKPKYYFAQKPSGTPVEDIPDGFQIQETVDGIVSLVRPKPSQLTAEDIAVVQSAISAHPKANRYLLYVKGDEITIHERVNSDLAEIGYGFGLTISRAKAEEYDRQNARYQPMMRFTLTDKVNRGFTAERRCFRSWADDWITIGNSKHLNRLASKFIPKLGTDAFYELF